MRRRTFIQSSASLSGASYLGFPLIRAKAKKYRVVLIGSGWWGMNILREAVKSGGTEVVGLCDVDQRQLAKASDEVEGWIGKKAKWYTDYRDCLEKTKPDIAIVATPDHWHALPTIAATEAGAHVYVEKPISHTILEGRAMVQAARRNKRVVQVGTHRRTSPHPVSAMEFLRSGKLGRISMVKCFVNRAGSPGIPTPNERIPEGLDWDAWIGPAPYRGYNPKIHPKGFRQFLDFANGTIGDWGIHWFDQVLWWSEQQHPTKVYSSGDRYVKADSTDAPDTQLAIYEFEDFAMTWEHKLCAENAYEKHTVGCYFYGTEGTLHLGWRDGWTFFPSAKSAKEIHMPAVLNEPDQQNIKELWANFVHAIETDTKPICDIERGYVATNMSLLAMISMKLGRSIAWDGKYILNDPEAAKLLSRPYRDPWQYPT